MSAKEDLVRDRLTQEAHAKEAKKRQEAIRREVELKERHDALSAFADQMTKKATLVIAKLEEANWREAELHSFAVKGKHWWSRTHKIELACLKFITAKGLYSLRDDGYVWPEPWSIWLRSDGVLLVQERNTGELRRIQEVWMYSNYRLIETQLDKWLSHE